jgi:hypothetical protein
MRGTSASIIIVDMATDCELGLRTGLSAEQSGAEATGLRGTGAGAVALSAATPTRETNPVGRLGPPA